ncbi:lipopolysaccharide biosynthesis protein [Clostridium cylindrosporum]|uniref:Polysaccharide biosynthesis protein n=1 Tax=Clostridium cylindrosporum DSM 605 TaxID=1121307 RepID=A0A0J8DGN8_CLOCY|nr:polysaccharide biosynthesis C-terminal domain-containing protein [Clostridium cylindrosporum]KMT23389.1 polysaccharide biosynthesis protein [Clostridium cylindrosporum DSM 605]
MDRYKKLISNTAIFGIGTFSSKVLVFLLMPLYTRVLSNSDYGIVDLLVQTSNLLIPIVSVGITGAVIRFGLDKSIDKKDVFSIGLFTIFAGFCVFLLLEPILSKLNYISEHTRVIYIFVLTSSLRSLCSQFVRAKQYVKLYAFDGVLSTITTIIYNILFLVTFRLGILGYVMAIIFSDITSVIFLFVSARLHRYIHIKGIKLSTANVMYRYAIPLIPTTIFWWITNVSDRYLVSYMIGSKANGLYAVSYKIPSVIVLVSGIFMDAWQMSAISEDDSADREKFFTKVFGAYQAIIFISASMLVLLSKFITKILVSSSFYPSWRYIPFLVMATIFSCFVTFLGSIYMVEKKSSLSLVTMVVGAVINVILNLLFIPKIGVNGAALATLISYLVVFILRVINTKKYIKIKWNTWRIVLNITVIFIQSIVMISEISYWIFYEILLLGVIILFNMNDILVSIRKLIFNK